jgi:hypothetical protein
VRMDVTAGVVNWRLGAGVAVLGSGALLLAAGASSADAQSVQARPAPTSVSVLARPQASFDRAGVLTFTTTARRAEATYTVPAPPAATKTVGSSLAKSIGETLQGAGNTVMAIGVTGLVASGVAAATGVAAPAALPSAGVSATVAATGFALSVVGGFIKNYWGDPIDFHYTRIALPLTVKVTRPSSTNPKVRAVYLAEQRMLSAAVNGYEMSIAFDHSVDRAHGALDRHNALWAKKQTDLAIKYAREGGKVMSELPARQTALYGALETAGVHVTLSGSSVGHATRTTSLKTARHDLAEQLAPYGLSRYASLFEAPTHAVSTASVSFPGALLDTSLISKEEAVAKTLAHYNAKSVAALIKASH